MRRLPVLSTAAALLALALAASGAVAEGIPDGSYETAQVAPGIYAFLPPEASTLVSGNTIAILGDHGVLVVDTGHYPSISERIVADLRKLTDLPVRYVVNTHWHYDHVMGNPIFAAAPTRRGMFQDAIVDGAVKRAFLEVAGTVERDESATRVHPLAAHARRPSAADHPVAERRGRCRSGP